MSHPLWLWCLHLTLPAVALPACALAIGRPPTTVGLMFLVLGVLTAYIGDRFRDHARVWPVWFRRQLIAVVLGCLVGLTVALWLTPAAWVVVLPLGVVVSIYPWLGRIAGVKELVVAGSWWVGIGILARIDQPWTWVDLLATDVLQMTLAILVATVLCDVKDSERDVEQGFFNLMRLTGRVPGQILGLATLGALAVWSLMTGGLAVVVLCILFAAMIMLPSILRHPLWAPIVIDGALALVGLLVGLWPGVS